MDAEGAMELLNDMYASIGNLEKKIRAVADTTEILRLQMAISNAQCAFKYRIRGSKESLDGNALIRAILSHFIKHSGYLLPNGYMDDEEFVQRVMMEIKALTGKQVDCEDYGDGRTSIYYWPK